MTMENAAPFPRLRTAYMRAIARAWHDPAYEALLVQESETNPRGALPMLEQDYGFTFPFNVKFAISLNNRPIYQPIGTTGWYGFLDEFRIPLPAKPTDPAHQAASLALYCQQFPSLLGAATDDVSEAPPDFAAFGVITSRLVALAWNDSFFHEQLFNRPDARELVQEAMNYIVQWNFHLKFWEYEVPSSPTVDFFAGSFPRSTIIVHLPQRPAALPPQGMGVEAIALAAYNDTGSQYPFTCA